MVGRFLGDRRQGTTPLPPPPLSAPPPLSVRTSSYEARTRNPATQGAGKPEGFSKFHSSSFLGG